MGPRLILQTTAAIEAAARRDPQFENDVRRVVGQLDYLGGRNIITTNVYGPYMHHQGAGDIVYGGIYKPYISAFPGDPSHSPAWVKAMIVIGMLAGLVGFAILGIGFFSFPGGPVEMKDVSDIPNFGLGLGVFLGGMATLALAQTIAMVTKRH